MDRTVFFDMIRSAIGPLSQDFVDGTEALLDEGEARAMRLEHQAYVLATAYHETAATMQPIAEYGKGQGKAYLTYYDSSKTKKCIYKPQDAYGRGFVQLTWEANYERADRECGLGGALVANFDLAMDMDIASKIIFGGMAAGWFTGKKLADYINDAGVDYYNARRIVNGTDRADQIAHYAKGAEKALRAAGWGATAPAPGPGPDPLDPALADLQVALQAVIDALGAVRAARHDQA